MIRSGFVHEAEAYDLLELAGLHPPRHGLSSGELPFETGEPVVVKGLGENVWHKSELGAVHFLPYERETVIREFQRMRERLESGGHRWLEGLVCEQIDIVRCAHLPSEAFVSLAFGEAGWILLLGFGGLQAETLAELAPPLRWPLAFTTPAVALREFESHLLGRIWLGRVRGSPPLTTIEKISRFLVALWALVEVADREELGLLELNPVALDREGEPRPLDAVGSRRAPSPPRLAPPSGFAAALCAPRRIALAGVSSQAGGVGRTILENLRRYSLPPGQLLLVKPGKETFLGLPCVSQVSALRADPVDLLILALPAPAAAETVIQLLAQGGGATCVALVAGGLGDGADRGGLGEKLAAQLQGARADGRWTPAVLGPNFLGHWVPGNRLDTSFIPTSKLTAPNPAGGELSLLSQSGAFLLSRRSRQPALRFGLGVALGNQLDVALCDLLAALAAEPGRGPIAAYVEGFGLGQLLPAAQAIAGLKAQGRTVLIHRAGRTAAGQAAAASHTGAMASDLALERTLLEHAGAKFADTIVTFDAALEWLSAWPHPLSGLVALLTNAGFESVNGGDVMDDRLPSAKARGSSISATATGAGQNPDAHPFGLSRLSNTAQQSLSALLAKHELTGLVAPRLPLDLTPMAGEGVFLECADLLLCESAALIIGLVPFTRQLDTTAAGGTVLANDLMALSRKHSKPVAVAIDAGADYASYRQCFHDAGLPVFDRMETALLGWRALV